MCHIKRDVARYRSSVSVDCIVDTGVQSSGTAGRERLLLVHFESLVSLKLGREKTAIIALECHRQPVRHLFRHSKVSSGCVKQARISVHAIDEMCRHAPIAGGEPLCCAGLVLPGSGRPVRLVWARCWNAVGGTAQPKGATQAAPDGDAPGEMDLLLQAGRLRDRAPPRRSARNLQVPHPLLTCPPCLIHYGL